jgi:type IVB pilus formation R64 PilN family outer membrane protein
MKITNTLKTLSILMASIFFVAIVGCAHKDAPKVEEIEAKGKRFDEMTKSKVMRVTDAPYLGAKSVDLRSNAAPVLQTRVTLRTSGSLKKVADMIRALVPITVNLAEDTDSRSGGASKASTQTPPANEPPQPLTAKKSDEEQDEEELKKLLASDPLPIIGGAGHGATNLQINYDGPLRGLLSQISAQSGFGWDYDKGANTVTFAKMMIRTFAIVASPGEINYETQLTNKSKENSTSGSSIGGNNVNSTVSTSDSSTQTNQTNKTKLKFDIWKDTENVVKAMLSKDGKVVSNQASGTLTVRDRPENIRQIASFIEDVNARFSRQVSLRVNVWSLDVNDSSEAGIDLQVLFRNDDVSIVAGSLAATVGGLNSAAATVVTGKLKDSTAIIKALKQWGNATQVTSGGAVAMNNQPAPILNTTRYSYLAGSSTQTTDYGQTVELTPGEVTTGFAMTVVPHIMENRKVVLQYTINLSSLDDLKTIAVAGTEMQLPQVSTRAFGQRVSMQMGQTLVLAGFAQSSQTDVKNLGLFAVGKGAGYKRTILVVTIEVENASPELGIEG